MEHYYTLDEHGHPRAEPDIDTWMRWAEQADLGVARTLVTSDVTVLTTFLGVGETSQADAPLTLFRNSVFGGVLDGEEVDHATRDAALAGHEVLVDWCRLGTTPDAWLPSEEPGEAA